VNVIGWPESRIILAQCVTYLASSPKSNAAYMAINHAQAEVKASGNLSVPLPLRNAPTKLMKEIGYGKKYKYAHDHPNNFIHQEYLPEEISGKKFYDPMSNARENELRKRLKTLWQEKYGY
jgi:putative ATPase